MHCSARQLLHVKSCSCAQHALACIVPLKCISLYSLVQLTYRPVLVSLQNKVLTGAHQGYASGAAGIQAIITTVAAVGVHEASLAKGSLGPVDWQASFR